jgi:hypothetical protein
VAKKVVFVSKPKKKHSIAMILSNNKFSTVRNRKNTIKKLIWFSYN